MSQMLRDGTTTEDLRLDRLVDFDERSRGFPIRATIDPTRKPRSYTWDPGAVCLDQGPDGACVGFSWTHELLARPAVYRGLDANFAKVDVYWASQKIDPWDGGSYPGASPFYEGTSVLAGAKICKQLGMFDEYRWAFGIDDLRLALGYKGPAVLGINWYTGMFDPDDRGYIRPTGGIAGGHAILAIANSEREKRITLFNSWGPSFGMHGRAFISHDDMARLLAEDGEACIPMMRQAQAKATT